MIRRLLDIATGKAPAHARRSPQWPTFRRHYLLMYPVCRVCGGHEKLEVHHIVPFHEKPELELDYRNVITLCESGRFGVTCHLWFGHLGNYRRSNPLVREDAAAWRERLDQAVDAA